MENTVNTLFAEKGIFFNEGHNFSQEDQGDKMYTLELNNSEASAEDQIIAICPGDNYSAADLSSMLGVTVASVISDGEIISTVDKKVTCAGTPGTVKSFVKRCLRAPQRFVGMSVEVTNAAQLSQPFKIYADDPFTGQPVTKHQVYPSQFKSNTQNNDKLVHIPLNHFQFSQNEICIVTLKAGGSLTIRFAPGAYVDDAKMLENEAKKEWSAKPIKREYAK